MGNIILQNGSFAGFDKSGKHRLYLTRVWDKRLPQMLYIGLNPSRADHTVNDPTIRRLISFTTKFGYGGFTICNLFSIKSEDPGLILKDSSPIFPTNDAIILKYASQRYIQNITCMWGNKGHYYNRDKAMLDLLKTTIHFPKCFGITKEKQPIHPLYIANNATLISYDTSR